MFTVKMIARPDARMVEVPLEIEAELPRDFEGAALLSSSGLPRKVKIKAQRDALKLSTAYRADQLLADVVRTVLRGSPIDIERVQIAAKNFVRAVRERRQDGATLTVESNGRGRIQVKEAMPPPREPRSAVAAVKRVVEGTVSDRITALERRLDQLEAKLARGAPAIGGDRVATLEKRLAALEERPAGPAVGEPRRGVLKGRGTAIEPFAEGLRTELRDRVAAHRNQAEEAAARCDKASALAVEAERVLGARNEGVSKHLLTVSSQAAARVQALERVHAEVELYAASDLPLAERLVARLVEGPLQADPTGPLERQAQALVRAARKENPELRAWLTRAAALCGWELIDPAPGEPLSTQLHVVVDSGGDHVARVAAPGVRRKDRSILCRARVLVSSEPVGAQGPFTGAEEVELLAEEFADEQTTPRASDDTPPPMDDRPPTQPLPAPPAQAIEPTRRLAMPKAPPAGDERAAAPPPVERATSKPAAAMEELAQSPSAGSSERTAAASDAVAAPQAALAAPAPEAPLAASAPATSASAPAGLAPAAAASSVPAGFDRTPAASTPAPADGADGVMSLLAATDVALSVGSDQPQHILEPPTPAEPVEAAVTTRIGSPQPTGGDDLALATEVAAAVETEMDEDPEWALLARGPAAFPTDAMKSEVSPKESDEEKTPAPDSLRD